MCASSSARSAGGKNGAKIRVGKLKILKMGKGGSRQARGPIKGGAARGVLGDAEDANTDEVTFAKLTQIGGSSSWPLSPCATDLLCHFDFAQAEERKTK